MKYSVFQTARAAINNFTSICSGTDFSTHPLIKRFMTGVIAQRPSLPKYTSIWDVNIVLSYINRMENTTLFQLSCKLCMLFLLLTVQRCQTLHLIQTDDIEFKDDTCLVHPNHLLKQSKPGHHLECVVLKEYKENQKQCIVQTLKEYLHHTAVLRSAEPKFLISTQ